MWKATLAAVAACCLIAIMQLSGLYEQPSNDVTVLSYHPPWEQHPTHYNRYRFKSSTQQLAEVHTTVKAQQHSVKAKTAKIDEGRAIFARLKEAAGSFNAKVKAQGKVTPLKLAEDVESAEAPVDEEGEPEAENEGPKTIYVYDGRETKAMATDLVTFILAAGFGMPDVRYIKSSSDADIRSATWDDDCRAIIFPPLHDIPDFAPNAVQDLRHYVSKGKKKSGTVLFLGSSVEVHIINELFGFEMQQDFKEGPYYKNARGTMGTVLQDLPPRVVELGNTESLGILKSSMPPETSSYYDSFGDSVASCVRWDLGRVCYLAQDFKPLEDLPELQERALSPDLRVAREAEYDLEVLSRKTDTWLAIFHGMLEQPLHATY